MLVMALVRECLSFKLQLAALGRFDIVEVPSWEVAFNMLVCCPIAACVVDPAFSGEPGGREIEQLRERFPAVPVVFYAQPTPATAEVLLRVDGNDAVFAGFEDHPKQFADRIRAAATSSTTEM